MNALYALVGIVLASFSGYAIHWAMHQTWSGPLYRSHMQHHLVHYPPENLYSKNRYRSSGLASGWLTFTPLVALAGAAVLAGLRLALHASWTAVAIVVATSAVLGWAHGYVHDAFHVVSHPLERFAWFARLRALHEPHHRDMRRNFGILWFGWDRLFKTFVE